MKYFFTCLVLLWVFTASGQMVKPIEKVEFCGHKFIVPVNCKAPSEYELSSDDYGMIWVYLKEDMLTTYPEKTMSLLASRMESFAKVPISCYLMDSPAQGYKISYKTTTGMAHQVIAYGKVNGQAVFVQLWVPGNPSSNADIPEFPRQIFRFTL